MVSIERATLAAGKIRRGQILVCAIVVGVLLLIFANIHLVYVALTSEPACVEHRKDVGDGLRTFRAAKSAC